MEYHWTKGILCVKRLLGHRHTRNSLRFIQPVAFKDNEYSAKVAALGSEMCWMMEAGFEHVRDYNGVEVFRKSR